MNDHGMWVRELEGHWGWMPFKFKFFFFFCLGLSHYDWLNPKEKTHHTLKVAQYKNFYPRWVVDFFSKSCFVLITFMNLVSKHDNFCQLSLKIWQNLQKYPKITIVAFACDLFFFFCCQNAKVHPRETIVNHNPPKLSSTQLHFWYNQKP